MARLTWAPQALEDLADIVRYIEQHAPIAARRFAQKLVGRVEQLSQHPLSGSLVPEDDTGVYRQLIQGNYRVIYRVTEDEVLIVAIYHAARLLDSETME